MLKHIFAFFLQKTVVKSSPRVSIRDTGQNDTTMGQSTKNLSERCWRRGLVVVMQTSWNSKQKELVVRISLIWILCYQWASSNVSNKMLVSDFWLNEFFYFD